MKPDDLPRPSIRLNVIDSHPTGFLQDSQRVFDLSWILKPCPVVALDLQQTLVIHNFPDLNFFFQQVGRLNAGIQLGGVHFPGMRF